MATRTMRQITGTLLTATVLLSLLFFSSAFAQSPLLLKKYTNQQITGWLMSEKLDGIRALWNGKELTTRQGKKLAVPDWFLQGFPPFAMDGELWSKRGAFEQIQSIVMRKKAHADWRQLTYNIFDIPEQKGGLSKRLAVLQQWMAQNTTPYLRIIPQISCRNKEHLLKFQQEIEAVGGEGVVLRDPDAPYIHGRTATALKVKRFDDTECTVISYNQGKGQFKEVTGSLNCCLSNGITFALGSGLNASQRKHPPAIGSLITFKHQGWTAKGMPRFPVFLHIREIAPPQKEQ